MDSQQKLKSNLQEHLSLLTKLLFSDMHIFAYSKREGTAAAKYKMLCGDVVKNRTKQAEHIALKKQRSLLQKFYRKVA